LVEGTIDGNEVVGSPLEGDNDGFEVGS
jgi:hypothetical protein